MQQAGHLSLRLVWFGACVVKLEEGCSWQPKFHYAVLQRIKCLSWNIPVDGSEGVPGPVVPVHELLAKSRAASCLSESLGEAPCDSFTVDSEAGLGGGRDEWDDFGVCCIVIKVIYGKSVILGMYIRLSCPHHGRRWTSVESFFQHADTWKKSRVWQ